MKTSLNTITTTLGYFQSLLEKKIGFSFRGDGIESIYNYHRLASGFRTSGQPTATQFRAIKRAGIKQVLNLAPSSAENSLNREAEIVEGLSMSYSHLPVDFGNPTEQDFVSFCDIVSTCERDRIWIHCAANMRVSAFMFRYRVFVLGESAAAAREDLEHIWEPFGVWKKFIAQPAGEK